MNERHDDRDEADRINPYASPRIPYEPPPNDDELCGVFRSGNELVVHRSAKLPSFCVKTNRPAEFWVEKTFTNARSFVPSNSVYAVKISFGLSDVSHARYRRHRMSIALGVLLGLAIEFFFFAIISPVNPDTWEASLLFLPFSGVAILALMPLYAYYGYRYIEQTRITATHVWLRGVHPNYLARLPEWPGG